MTLEARVDLLAAAIGADLGALEAKIHVPLVLPSDPQFGGVGDAAYNDTGDRTTSNWTGTDDTAAVNAAYAFAEANGLCVFFDRLYKCDGVINIKSGAQFYGAGPNTGIAMTWVDYLSSTEVAKKTLFAPETVAYVDGVPNFHNAKFVNFAVYGPWYENWHPWGKNADNTGRSISYVLPQRSTGIHVKDMHFQGVGCVTIGAHVDSCFENNRIKRTGRDGITVGFSSVDHDHSRPTYVYILGNVLEETGDDSISVQGLNTAMPPFVAATTTAGSRTITLASDPGDIVGQGVCIKGAGQNSTKLGAKVVSQTGVTIEIDRPAPLTVTDDMSYDCYAHGKIMIAANKVNNKGDGRGIMVRNLADMSVLSNTVDNAAIHDIYVGSDSFGSVSFDSVIDDNDCNWAGSHSLSTVIADGINLSFVSEVRVTNNRCRNNSYAGIYATLANACVIKGNEAKYNNKNATSASAAQIEVKSSGGVQVLSNDAIGGYKNGVLIKDTEGTVFIGGRLERHVNGAVYGAYIAGNTDLRMDDLTITKNYRSMNIASDNVSISRGTRGSSYGNTNNNAPYINPSLAANVITNESMYFDPEARGFAALQSVALP